jgi:hypothetical protein
MRKFFTLIIYAGAAVAAAALIFGQTVSAAEFAARSPSASAGKSNVSAQALLTENETDPPALFFSVLEAILSQRRLKRADFCDETDPVQRRVLKDYGAVLLAAGRDVRTPPVCVFPGEKEVAEFQTSIVVGVEEIDGVEIELQAAAMAAYLAARREAQSQGLDITPRDGAEGARRSFADTQRLWNSRFLPAADFWRARNRLTAAEVEKLKTLPLREQVREVLNLEKRGIFFNTSFTASIIYSVAPPGASQHLSMLALDVNEYRSKKVRDILARHGWFRTVKMDAPHFTFLGRKKEELKSLGLKKFVSESGEYWIPNI